MRFSVEFKYTICILRNYKKVRKGGFGSSPVFLERTRRASIQKKALSFSDLLIKLIEPTFSKNNIRFSCVHERRREKVVGKTLLPVFF